VTLAKERETQNAKLEIEIENRRVGMAVGFNIKPETVNGNSLLNG